MAYRYWLLALGSGLLFFIIVVFWPQQKEDSAGRGRPLIEAEEPTVLRCKLERNREEGVRPFEGFLLFPEPKVLEYGVGATRRVVALSEDVIIRISAGSPSTKKALEHFCATSLAHGPGTTHINVHVARSGEDKERYEMEMSATEQNELSIGLFASGGPEALHPMLATLSLMLSRRPVKTRLPLHLKDWPRYRWRGLLVDVARHWLSLEHLRRCLDAMQIAKLNVLHLHLTDTQSFPVLLHDEPGLPLSQLALKGSFGPSSVYSLKALRELEVYARDRGVVIVPEIDLPAHSRSWGRAFPDLVFDIPRNVNWTQRGVTEEMLPLDISSPRLLGVVAAVLKQIAREAFPLSPFFHIGGDEVRPEPWLAVPRVQSWMQAQGFSLPQQAFAAFEKSLLAVVEGLGRRPMVWQEALDTGVLPNSSSSSSSSSLPVVQPWKCWGGHSLRAADAALRRGLPVVVSSCWYLDSDTDWLTLLSSDQAADALARLPPDLALSAHGQVWGGEASMWTERVDEGNFECRVWPRAAAVAARLWGWSSHPHHQGNSSVGKALDALTLAKLPTLALSRVSLRAAPSAGGATVAIDRRTSVSLHAGLAHMRWFLSAALGVAAAPLVFFNNSSPAGPRRTARTEEEALALIRETVGLPRTLTSDDKLVPPGPRMSAICPLLGQLEVPQPVPPASASALSTAPRMVRAAQLNIADGSPGPRLAGVTSWLRSKASAGALYVGLCELNGWQQEGLMRERALAAGFAFSHVTSSKDQPYHVGIVASQHFAVLNELGPPTLQRALLHVHFAPPLDLHVVVAHLHAHDSGKRREEAALIVSKVLRPLLQQNKCVVLQGDLNTLAESDAPTHDKQRLVHILTSAGPGYSRLARKFLTPDRAAVDYEPLQLLLRAGMVDPCALNATTNKICGATVPTNFSTEADLGSASPHPALRLDYMLLSPRIVREAAAGAQIAFITERSDVSDHLPLSLSMSVS